MDSAQSRLPVSSKNDTSDIIAKLEGASGPDRELDAEIGRAADVVLSGTKSDQKAWLLLLPRYSASLDAALALVEEKLPGLLEYSLSMQKDQDGRSFIFLPHLSATVGDIDVGDNYAPTASLAVLIALFKALSETSSSEAVAAG